METARERDRDSERERRSQRQGKRESREHREVTVAGQKGRDKARKRVIYTYIQKEKEIQR